MDGEKLGKRFNDICCLDLAIFLFKFVDKEQMLILRSGDRGRFRWIKEEWILSILLLFDDVKEIFSYSLESNGIISSSSVNENEVEC